MLVKPRECCQLIFLGSTVLRTVLYCTQVNIMLVGIEPTKELDSVPKYHIFKPT